MSTPEVIRAMGGVLKDAAQPQSADEFRRSQILSAYSVSRHLAAEEAARPALEASLRAELGTVLAGRRGAEAVAAAAGVEELGTVISDVLAELRSPPEDAESRRLSAELRAALRRLCDLELAALANA